MIVVGLLVLRFSPLSSRRGSIQAGMALEELKVLCLVPKANSRRLAPTWLGGGSQNPPPQ